MCDCVRKLEVRMDMCLNDGLIASGEQLLTFYTTLYHKIIRLITDLEKKMGTLYLLSIITSVAILEILLLLNILIIIYLCIYSTEIIAILRTHIFIKSVFG